MSVLSDLELIKNEYDAFEIRNKYQGGSNGELVFSKKCSHYKQFVSVWNLVHNDARACNAVWWIRDFYDCYYKDELDENSSFAYLEGLIKELEK